MFTRIVQVSQFEVPCVPTRFPCSADLMPSKTFFLFLFVCAVYTHVNTPSLNVGNVCCHRVATLSDSPVPSHIGTMKYIFLKYEIISLEDSVCTLNTLQGFFGEIWTLDECKGLEQGCNCALQVFTPKY